MQTELTAPVEDEVTTAEAGDGDDDEGGGGLRLHVSLDEKVEIARAAATQIFAHIGAGVPSVEVAVEDEQIVVRLRDLNPILAASADARILESIQFLLNKAVNKLALRRSRLSLDAEGFRRRRPDNFDQLAATVAARVVALGKAMAIGPLGQTEVRLLGHQIERAGGVTVKVDGPHDRRRLVVAPKVAPSADPVQEAASDDGAALPHGHPGNGGSGNDGNGGNGNGGKRHRRRY